MTLSRRGPASIEPAIFARILRDLSRLPRSSRRIDVEAAVWRSVGRHMSTLTAEQINEVTWKILDDLAGATKNVA